MKKKILAVSVIIACLAIGAYGTLAYFTHEDTATNVITTGSVTIDLEELAIPEDGGDPVPFEDVIDVMPGDEVSKIVQIKNTGDAEAWVRISLDKSLILADGVEGEVDLSLVTYDINTENWTEKDGCYYYNTPLAAGETTEPLFTEVIFSTEMGNMYQHSKAVIKVDAEAVQTANNGKTVFESAGWAAAE